MKNNIISTEIRERIKRSAVCLDIYEIVGVEIKAKRLKKRMTLDAVCAHICSVSYLCKIERNKIEPNRVFLREICRRLDLDDGEIDVLMNLKECLSECVEAFLFGNAEVIDRYFEEGKNLDNYRYSIIKFIYYLAHKEITMANLEFYNILPLTSTMRDFDLHIFALFSGYLQLYNCRFIEASESLYSLKSVKLTRAEELLRDVCLFKASFGINRHDTSVFYEKVKNNLMDYGPIELLDECRYIICIYYIKNNCEFLFQTERESLRNEIYIRTVDFLMDYSNKNISKLFDYDENSLSEFASLILLSLKDFNQFKEFIPDAEKDYYTCDYDYPYLDYLAHHMDTDFQKYLFNELIPKVSNSDDEYMKAFMFNEVFKLPFYGGKNKNMAKAYTMLYGGSEENDPVKAAYLKEDSNEEN